MPKWPPQKKRVEFIREKLIEFTKSMFDQGYSWLEIGAAMPDGEDDMDGILSEASDRHANDKKIQRARKVK